ncbi:hypothetical protein N9Q44_03320 [Gammaproteobacteria bacterium]|nr:hypothetical protein [Gammaproteobacteria bacterium]
MDKRSWVDNGEAIVSTNINFDSVDENGGQQWVAGSFTDYSGEILRNSGSNTRTTSLVADLTDVPSEIDLTGYTEVVVESGTNTWLDAQGQYRTWTVTKYFELSEGGQFLGEIGTGSDGFSRVIDKNGNEYSSNSSNNGEWTTIQADTYTLDLPPASWGGWNLQVKGTGESETLDLAAIALEQDLAADGINVDAIYTGIYGAGGNDKLYGAGGMDSLRVHFDGSNLVDGRTNPSYLGSDGNFFSAHDRYVIFQDVTSREEWYQGNYVLIGVDAIVAQSAGNADVALKDLATSDALQIDSFVNLMSGELEEDMSQLLSLLSQIAEKAVSLGIGDMPLGDLTSLMLKVQSVSLEDQSLTIEVDFIKDIDMVSVVGVLADGSEFTPAQVFINPVEYTLADDDNFSNPYSLGVRGSYQGTNASDQVDRSGENSGVGYSFRMGDGDDVVVGTDYDDVINLQGGGTKTIDGGLGNDAADINIIGMWDDGGGYGLNVEFDEGTGTYTVFDTYADNMEKMLTVSPNEAGGWSASSTDYAKQKFYLSDANLTNVESIRIFIGTDPENNNEAVYQTLDLSQAESWTTIQTDTYTLDLPPASWGGWNLQVKGTGESETLDLAAIALEQDLAADGINVDAIYTGIYGAGGNDKLYGAGGMDSLRVHFDGSNLVDGRTNPSYLGSDGNFFSAHDRYVIFQDVTSREEWYQGNYVLIGVDAIVAQSAGNADVALKDLATSDALQIDSFVNLMSGELEEDMSQLLSLLSQIAEKAVSLGIGDMPLGDLTSLMLKVQSVSLEDQSLTIEVDFIKDIDMVSVVGVLADGSEFTPAQVFINPVEYTLADDDNFSNPYSLGVRGSYQGTNASDQVDRSGENSGVGYSFRMGDGDDVVVGTDYDDVINLQGGGTKTIDGGLGNDAADINIIGMWDDGGGYGLNVEFDEGTGTYTVFDTYADNMEKMLTVSPNEAGGWSASSTDYAKQKFYLSDANLTNVESIRIFIGTDPENNNEAVYRTLDLTVSDKFIRTDTYTLDLTLVNGLFGPLIRVYGTDGSDVLNIPGIVLDQDLASRGIDASNVYFVTDSGGGDDTLIGGTNRDLLSVSSDGSNFLDGGGHSPYLGGNGYFYSGVDRAGITKEVATAVEFSIDDYVLLSVPAIEAQDGANAAVLLKDLGSGDVLSISSVVNVITGKSEDIGLITSMLSQVSAKAVSLGIGDMALGELDGLLIKIQSVQADGQIIDVDFLKDIGRVDVVGELPDGSGFGESALINPVQFTLDSDDSFNDLGLGVRSSYEGTNTSETIDLSTAADNGAGYTVSSGKGDDTIIGTQYADIINLSPGDNNIDGGDGDDVLDITSYLNDGHSLTVNFDSATMTYTAFDTTVTALNDEALSDSMMFTAALQESGSWRVESSDWGKENFRLGDVTLTNVESIRVFHAFDNNEPVYQTLDLVGVMPVQNG